MKRLIGKVAAKLSTELQYIDNELCELTTLFGSNVSLNTKVQDIRKKVKTVQEWIDTISYDLNGDK